MQKPLISIITVVYNDVNHIEDTIKSTLSQTWNNLEYIIVDGNSDDGTLEIIKKYEKHLIWLSEKDNGIYDAMMKGARMASGEWLLFRNSGDFFYNEKAIENVFSNYEDHGESFIAGGIRYFTDYGYKDNMPNIKKFSIFDAVPFDHPATFIRRLVQLKYPFHLEYKNSADYCCFLEVLLDGGTYYISEAMIARMDCSQGTTAEHYDRCFIDNIKILRQFGAPKKSVNKQRMGLLRYRISAFLRKNRMFEKIHNLYRRKRWGYIQWE
jgi:glycosyltransferase involved in cell wall biosynthesis